VIQGSEDLTTPPRLVLEFVKTIRGPRKAFVALEGGDHFAVFMHSDAFLAELVKLVSPLTLRRGSTTTTGKPGSSEYSFRHSIGRAGRPLETVLSPRFSSFSVSEKARESSL
jgi:hypothetical protein